MPVVYTTTTDRKILELQYMPLQYMPPTPRSANRIQDWHESSRRHDQLLPTWLGGERRCLCVRRLWGACDESFPSLLRFDAWQTAAGKARSSTEARKNPCSVKLYRPLTLKATAKEGDREAKGAITFSIKDGSRPVIPWAVPRQKWSIAG